MHGYQGMPVAIYQIDQTIGELTLRRLRMRNETNNPLHALVLNDNDLETQLIEMLLGNEFIDCSVAANEAEAAVLLDFIKPHIVIASWRAGVMDGRDLVCRLKKVHSHVANVPGLLITDRKLSFRQRMECAQEGFNWIVQTPFTPENFACVVKRLIIDASMPNMQKHRPIGGIIPQGSCPTLQAVNMSASGLIACN
jgi:response regulator RpfG family c-di-GMP phosphodiesterase